jgi:hypothetical protein
MAPDEAHAHAEQLAALLEGILKLSGHLDAPVKDITGLIEVAQCLVTAGPQPALVPVVIVSLEGGTIVESYGTHPARVIFLDGDTEGGDSNQVVDVFGEAKYVTDGMLHVRPHSVADVLEEMAAHSPHEEEEGEAETDRP